MSSTKPVGQLCNQIIRNLALSIIAEKQNLHVTYTSHNKIEQLGIKLFIGDKKYDISKDLTEDNYLNYFNIDDGDLHYNLITARGTYFQTIMICLLCL